MESKLIIAVGLICLLMGVLIGFGISIIPENKCIKNPLYYGISSLETDTLKVNCYCNFNSKEGITYYQGFFFNKSGVFALK